VETRGSQLTGNTVPGVGFSPHLVSQLGELLPLSKAVTLKLTNRPGAMPSVKITT
jgi:hypothetical protein